MMNLLHCPFIVVFGLYLYCTTCLSFFNVSLVLLTCTVQLAPASLKSVKYFKPVLVQLALASLQSVRYFKPVLYNLSQLFLQLVSPVIHTCTVQLALASLKSVRYFKPVLYNLPQLLYSQTGTSNRNLLYTHRKTVYCKDQNLQYTHR